MEERTGEAFELGEQLTVVGRKLAVGDTAPAFALDYLDPTDAALRTVRLADSAGQVRLLNVVNSLDTLVCHLETRRWEDRRSDLPEAVLIFTVSMDLPYAQARWQAAEEVLAPWQPHPKGVSYSRFHGCVWANAGAPAKSTDS